MATTLVPPTPATKPPASGLRFVAVRADLLPDEIISARQADVVRRKVLIGLALVVALLVAWFGASWWQTSGARSDLTDQQRQAVASRNQQNEFGPLVAAQNGAQSIRTELQKLMAGDLPWKTMLTALRAQAPAGVTLTNVSATMTAGAAVAGNGGASTEQAATLNQSGKQEVGNLTLTGTGPDKNSVAAYADRLSRMKGLTAPLITSVVVADRTVTFTIDVIVTSDALGGRYAVATPTIPGGK
jgi:Tfp pilus assembly protein PilN